ncbi:hypothetical protein ACQ5CJ_10865 [Weissella cibaria]
MNTQKSYRATSKKLHESFPHIRVDQLRFEDLDVFAHANQHGSVMRGSRIDKHLNKINQFLNFMANGRYIERPPFGEKDYLRQIFGTPTQRHKITVEAGYGKPIVYLSSEERRWVLDHLRYNVKWGTMRVSQQVGLIAILLAATIGLRQQEIKAVLPSDLETSARGTRVSVTKSYHEGEPDA